MDFPLFHLDWMGNRMLIALIAIVHVLINHALAVGFLPLIVLLEYLGFKKRTGSRETSLIWDNTVQKMMLVGFVITTSLGALTGVGIWLSAALVNPNSIGSLIRVFYMAWFTEWIIFVLEVVFIMIYYLTWNRSREDDRSKQLHIRFGVALSVFSWLTMAIIVAILGFMMDTGNWLSDQSFLSGVLNPLYLPQLFFRTPLAMMMGGAVIMLMIGIFTRGLPSIRKSMLSFASLWLLIWTPAGAVGALYYYSVIPDAMVGNLPTAVGTMAFSDWYDSLLTIILVGVVISLLVSIWGLLKPLRMPRLVLLVPILALALFLGSFERIREFVRKPYVIGEYMYSNGLRVEDYPLFRRDGLLAHATFTKSADLVRTDPVRAGRDVFLLSCSRCHTLRGLNSVISKFKNMSPDGQTLDPQAMTAYVPKMHNVWFYMPPFPGNEEELDAMIQFIVYADRHPEVELGGAQREGLSVSDKPAAGPRAVLLDED